MGYARSFINIVLLFKCISKICFIKSKGLLIAMKLSQKVLKELNIKIILLVSILILLLLKKVIFAILLLSVLGAFSIMYKRFLSIGIGFEMITLCTVIGSIKYGATVGIIVAIFSVLGGYFLSNKLFRNPGDFAYQIFAYVLLGIIAASFAPENILSIGLGFVVVYNIIFVGATFLFYQNFIKAAIFVPTHILFNILFFSRFAEPLLNIV